MASRRQARVLPDRAWVRRDERIRRLLPGRLFLRRHVAQDASLVPEVQPGVLEGIPGDRQSGRVGRRGGTARDKRPTGALRVYSPVSWWGRRLGGVPTADT